MKTTERVAIDQSDSVQAAPGRPDDGREKDWPAPGEVAGAGVNTGAADRLAGASAELQPNTAERETILIVDDEIGLRELVGDALRQQHYRVLVASTGVEALKIWEQQHQRIDLLLTDMVMPGGLTGGALAAELKMRKPGLKIIFTSGYCPELIGKDLLSGDVAFLPKPYLAPHLAQIVRQCLDGTLKIKPHRMPVVDADSTVTTASTAV